MITEIKNGMKIKEWIFDCNLYLFNIECAKLSSDGNTVAGFITYERKGKDWTIGPRSYTFTRLHVNINKFKLEKISKVRRQQILVVLVVVVVCENNYYMKRPD